MSGRVRAGPTNLATRRCPLTTNYFVVNEACGDRAAFTCLSPAASIFILPLLLQQHGHQSLPSCFPHTPLTPFAGKTSQPVQQPRYTFVGEW